MIERDVFGEFTVYCDFCSESEDTNTDSFHEAVAHIRGERWAVYKDKGEWTHKCPSCRQGDGSEF